jgi:hypothetical protein
MPRPVARASANEMIWMGFLRRFMPPPGMFTSSAVERETMGGAPEPESTAD